MVYSSTEEEEAREAAEWERRGKRECLGAFCKMMEKNFYE